jgi:carbonic anhydrase/acetyltransferase-like protein (isoleucine patch superfamily)
MHGATLQSNIIIGDQSLIPVYCILGDDVAIANGQLAQSYVHLRSNVLDVVINPIKGFEGKVIEFANMQFDDQPSSLLYWLFTSVKNVTLF